MKIIERKINELIGSEYNPRELTEKQHADLADSLNRFGCVDPVLVNMHEERKNIIIGGHQRTKVWKALGNDVIPCVEMELTPAQEKELNIRLNKNTGQFDFDALANYFDESELIDWGFEAFEFGVAGDVDYSVLDDENVDSTIDNMEGGVKRAIQIPFDDNHYDQANELFKFFREKGVYIGGAIVRLLEDEKLKV